jgi:TRAP-type C4-dicarboxylate transport system substrate-binding protein
MKPLAALVLAVAAAATLTARAPVTIKLATIAPTNSTWHKALLDMGDTWKKTTAAPVSLSVYPGGTLGDEPAVIDKMRNKVLQAGLLMTAGLAEIDKGFNVFGIPFFFESDDEGAAVRTALEPMLEKSLEAKGFHMLCWGTAGWAQLFSKNPVKTLDDVRKTKLFTLAGDPKMVQWYQSNGFKPVPLSSTDLVAQLKLPTGQIDAAAMPTYVAMIENIFTSAKYMLDVHADPLIGGVIITNDAWASVSAADQAKLVEAAKAFEKRINAEAPKLDASSLATMVSRGLQVTTPDARTAAEFRAEAAKMAASMRDTIVPKDVFDAAVQARDGFRKSKGK